MRAALIVFRLFDENRFFMHGKKLRKIKTAFGQK